MMKVPGTVLQYPAEAVKGVTDAHRWRRLYHHFVQRFQQEPRGWVSVPGRLEIGGNHTDHHQGRVIAAAVDLDMLAAFAPLQEPVLIVRSLTLNQEFSVTAPFQQPENQEKGTAAAFLRGIAAGFMARGIAIQGMVAVLDSRIPVGAGLSSSAAYAVTIATILNKLYAQNSLSLLELALIARYAENQFFGKPCGLMDQVACAFGGMILIDFKTPHPL